MRLSDAMTGIGRPVVYYPRLARFFGSVNAAIFFSQLFYWQSRTENPDGVFKTSEEWERETGLSYREQSTARKELRELRFLKERNRRLEHRIYDLLDTTAIDDEFHAWWSESEPDFASDESAIRETTKAQSGNVEN